MGRPKCDLSSKIGLSLHLCCEALFHLGVKQAGVPYPFYVLSRMAKWLVRARVKEHPYSVFYQPYDSLAHFNLRPGGGLSHIRHGGGRGKKDHIS